MLSRAERLGPEDLQRLHRDFIEDRERIHQILGRLEREQVVLRRGLSPKIDPELGRVAEIDGNCVSLQTRDFDIQRSGQSFLSFDLDGARYLFEVQVANEHQPGDRRKDWLTFEIPRRIYTVERRSFDRRTPEVESEAPRRVELSGEDGLSVTAEVIDWSYDGICVRMAEADSRILPSEVTVRYLAGPSTGARVRGELRHRAGEPDRTGMVRVGLAVTQAPHRALIPVERREQILDDRLTRREAAADPDAHVQFPTDVPLERFTNDLGEELVAIVDTVGDRRGAPAVVIPPAWGKTKETLLPLASTIAATFARAGESVVILRHDGVRRRGESHTDPMCRAPGREFERFTMSQGVRDLETALGHLERAHGCDRTALVSFSASAVEARRVTSTDSRVAGWVSVVGAADLQSALRVVSGGIDFPYGRQRGVRFGIQEILGLPVDMDLVADDSLEHGLWFAEDARRDMARVTVPVTWIHGRHDAWMDFDRAREMLSCGDTSKRRMIEIPIGHQLRSSELALQTFQLIALEVLQILTGKSGRPTLPDLAQVAERQRAERDRIKRPELDLHGFWQDYLLGRDGGLGIDLMAAMSPYEELMALQIRRLRLGPGARVADLGAGTGALLAHIGRSGELPPGVEVVALDFVSEALKRTRVRARPLMDAGGVVSPICCNVDVPHAASTIPLRSGTHDAVLASLLISYLGDPKGLLREAHRVLRPNGRLVVSSLRRDADTSKLYVEGVEELKAGRGRALLGEQSPGQVERATRSFLNDAARLLELEENGTFRFFDPEELSELVREAGFRNVRVDESFGAPPQAVVVSACR